jgi:hypothetical protein
MPASREPHPEHDRDRQPRDLRVVLVDYGARLAMQWPWRYAATWAVGIGAANLGLRLLLNDLPLAQNARLAALAAAGFFVVAWLSTTQLTRPPAPSAPGHGRRGRLALPAGSPVSHRSRSPFRVAVGMPRRAGARAERTGPPGRPIPDPTTPPAADRRCRRRDHRRHAHRRRPRPPPSPGRDARPPRPPDPSARHPDARPTLNQPWPCRSKRPGPKT